MDKVVMKNLGFYGYHGAMKEENVLGQRFFFDVELTCNLPAAGKTDRVEDTVHYGEVYETIKDIVENRTYNLIEKVAEEIAQAIFERFEKVKEVDILVKKPSAPVAGVFDYMGVHVRRKRPCKSAYLGIGGNMGDKKSNIERAIELLDESDFIKVKKSSSLYETEPVGYTDQDWFMNAVTEIETSLSPYELLDYCHYIESELKRERLIRWGPRTLDVDVLLYEGFESDDEVLTVPHPRMLERAFVMVPLFEINKGLAIGNKPISEIMADFKGEEIRKI